MKAFKYSSVVTFWLAVLSAIAIFVIDDVLDLDGSSVLKNHILENLDNYNAFLVGMFTAALVSLIIAIVSYATERRRLISEFWNSARKLTLTFKLLLLDHFNSDVLSEQNLIEMAEKYEFNLQVREWHSLYSSNYLIVFTQISFFFKQGKICGLLSKINTNVETIKTIMDTLMNTYLNKNLNNAYGQTDIKMVVDVIAGIDKEQLIRSLELQLDDLLNYLKADNVKEHMSVSRHT
ncbi:hypothetical protein Q5O24_05730 [Eubacteriaceae bacterium ES3]|nr:hypothetical protein Q5O24_05730 [Eubacteriaceae bacterium ES3]